VTLNDYGGLDFLHAGSAERFPKAARTIFSAFKDDVPYFQPSEKPFMINLMVDDLDGMLARLEEKGVPLTEPVQDHDYGRFAWVMDPNGVKVELWQPIEPPAGT
jgi:predicted enzyme related to lactoylglutathione lyase